MCHFNIRNEKYTEAIIKKALEMEYVHMYKCQEISNVILALSYLSYDKIEKLDYIKECILESDMLNNFKTQELCNIIWSFGKLKIQTNYEIILNKLLLKVNSINHFNNNKQVIGWYDM